MICVLVAMLCKEQGITATAVCVLYEIFVVQRVSTINFLRPDQSISLRQINDIKNPFLIQVRALDIFLAIKSAFGGNKITPTWSGEGTKRLAALTLVTFSLLILRLHVMGSKLPVFTR